MKRSVSILLAGILVLSMTAVITAQSKQKAMCQRAQSKGETVTLQGEITNILNPLATFRTGDKEYAVHLGPAWYWKQENFKLAKGKVEITGEQEEIDGQWNIYPSKIIQGKTTIVLMTEDGSTKWAKMKSGKGKAGGRHCGSNGRSGSCCRRQ